MTIIHTYFCVQVPRIKEAEEEEVLMDQDGSEIDKSL